MSAPGVASPVSSRIGGARTRCAGQWFAAIASAMAARTFVKVIAVQHASSDMWSSHGEPGPQDPRQPRRLDLRCGTRAVPRTRSSSPDCWQRPFRHGRAVPVHAGRAATAWWSCTAGPGLCVVREEGIPNTEPAGPVSFAARNGARDRASRAIAQAIDGRPQRQGRSDRLDMACPRGRGQAKRSVGRLMGIRRPATLTTLRMPRHP